MRDHTVADENQRVPLEHEQQKMQLSGARLFWRRARRNRNIWAGGIGIALVGVAIVVGPSVVRFKPFDVDTSGSLAAPNAAHLLGTDQFGRDVLSRVLSGGRLTIGVAFLAVALGMIPGTAIGIASALAGYKTDLLVMRGIDILMAFPSILLALMIVAIQGPGITNAMVAVGISLAPTYVRVVRGAVLSICEKQYIEAAEAIGCGLWRTARKHILPNIFSTVLVLSTVAIGWAILIGSSLSFLGLGPQPPTPEWGVDLANGRSYLQAAWWITTFPGLAIMITVLSVNLLGDGLRDLWDPHLRGVD